MPKMAGCHELCFTEELEPMRRALSLMLLLVCWAPQLLAADVSGNWSLDLKREGRQVTLKLALKQDGDSLTGTVRGPRRSYPIAKGSVENDHIEMVLGGDGPFAGATISGTILGDRMRLTVETSRGSAEGTAVKAPSSTGAGQPF
jgi:hypothetical protein